MDDVAGVGEAAMFHYGARCAVVGEGEGDDSVEAERVEGVLQSCEGDFGGEAFAPVAGGDGVGQFDLVAAFDLACLIPP